MSLMKFSHSQHCSDLLLGPLHSPLLSTLAFSCPWPLVMKIRFGKYYALHAKVSGVIGFHPNAYVSPSLAFQV